MEFGSLVARIAKRCQGYEVALVALSGGVDSGLVAAAAHAAVGSQSIAVTVSSELTPKRDLDQAKKVAEHIGIHHEVLPVSVLENAAVRSNGPDRCYHCKKLIFRSIFTHYNDSSILLDGTNYDDDPARPGLKAVCEFKVYSPLRDLGLAKEKVRSMAHDLNMPNWNTPSESCLATRIQSGCELSASGLSKVEALESFYHNLGVDTLRVRHDNLVAIVEYEPQYAKIISENRENFMALAESIGMRSCKFKEWRE